MRKRHIIVTDYNPNWPAIFEGEAEKIREILGPICLAIHQIGSTAVPGLKAKPTIDLMPVVTDIRLCDPLKSQFEALGYEYLGEYGIPGRRYLRKIEGENDLFHIHIFSPDNQPDIDRHLALRDFLRTHKEAAKDYGDLKSALASRFPYDNDGYCDGKEQFVKKLEQEALLWAKGNVSF